MKPKKFCLLVSTLMLSAFYVDAQVTEDMYSVKNDAVVVEKVIPFSVSKDMASAAVKSYFLTTLNDSNVTLKNSSDDYYVAKITWKLNIFKKYAEETFNNLVLYMALIVEELNTSVQNAKEEEDW